MRYVTAPRVPTETASRLSHVRWIVGGTGAGKSTVAALLAERCDVDVYSGDRAEHDWLRRCSPERQPHLAALRGQRPGDNWRNRSATQAYDAMAGRHGETAEFLVEDLLAPPSDRTVLVDYFGVLPHDLAPLLDNPTQAAVLLPTPQFRRARLTERYADPNRARRNWGDLDPAQVIELRLGRDALWDAAVAEQAAELGLRVITVDGSRPPGSIADELIALFGLSIAGSPVR